MRCAVYTRAASISEISGIIGHLPVALSHGRMGGFNRPKS